MKSLDAHSGRMFRRSPDRWPGYTTFRLEHPRISPEQAAVLTGYSGAAWERQSAAAVNANVRAILRELNRGLSPDRRLRVDAAINRYPHLVRIAE